MAVQHAVGSAISYALVSSAMTFANKALSSSFSFRFPLFLLLIQMITTQALLLIASAFGFLRYPIITWRGLKQHAPVASLYSLNAALAIASLHAVSIPTYGVLKRAGPLYILLISSVARLVALRRLKGEKKHWEEGEADDCEAGKGGEHRIEGRRIEERGFAGPGGGDARRGGDQTSDGKRGSVLEGEQGETEEVKPEPWEAGPGVVAGVLVIVAGTLLAGWSDVFLSPLAFQMAMLSNLTQGMYVIMVEAKHKGKLGIGPSFNYGAHVDPSLGLLAHNSLLAVPFLLLAILSLAAARGAKEQLGFLEAERYNSSLVAMLLLANILGVSLNYTMYSCIRHNSALTTSLVGHGKTAVQTAMGFFVLAKDVDATANYVAGVMLNFLGGVLFSVGKYKQVPPFHQPKLALFDTNGPHPPGHPPPVGDGG